MVWTCLVHGVLLACVFLPHRSWTRGYSQKIVLNRRKRKFCFVAGCRPLGLGPIHAMREVESENSGDDVSSAPVQLAVFAANNEECRQQQREKDDSNPETERVQGRLPRPFVMSKSKWKKKRYLMMQDVVARIERKDPAACKKAAEMVRRMKRLYDLSGSDLEFRPTRQAYNLWIHALAKSSSSSSISSSSRHRVGVGTSAEQVLKEMIKEGVTPDVISYTAVMDAYAAQSKHDASAAGHAERILFDLLEMADSAMAMGQKKNFTVTSVTSDTVINAWAQQGTWQGAMRAQEILERLVEWTATDETRRHIRPTSFSYASVIHAWASCGGGAPAAAKAQALLDSLLESAKNDDAKTRRRKEQPVLPVEPDTVIFNSVIHAWATSGDPQAGNRAAGLLRKMRSLHQAEGYNCSPDTVTYNTVLSAWSHSGHVHAAAQAERILQRMVSAHRENSEAPAPNTVSYNTVLHAWSKSGLEGAADRAETLLDYMIRQPEISPDIYSFSSALDALAKSKVPDKAVRARNILDRLFQMHDGIRNSESSPSGGNLRLSQIPFNTVINAAAFSAQGTSEQEQRKALQVAVQTFSLMRRKKVVPDTVTYGNLLKSFANLMPPGRVRTDMALQMFEACCREGLVGELVWKEIQRAVPTRKLEEHLMGNNEFLIRADRLLSMRDLPPKWRRSVRGDRKAAPKPGAASPKTHGKRSATRKEAAAGAGAGAGAPVRRLRNISETSYQSGRDL